MHSDPDTLRVKEIFEKAIEISSAGDRQGYVSGTCNGDASLLARVQTLLHAHFESGETFLPANPATASTSHVSVGAEERTGDVVGRYRLLQKIGEGGCGSVWMAEQSEPVRRRVALKVIKLGMDTKSVVARFEAERQALAIMDHPNIAKVHDAGATETGRPFFVMELVRGIPITRYCDENHLTPTARLELFIKVCQAVNHAHQKGIIHRDLKPSNILVTVNDGAPTPKIIDFGIAKATQGRLTDATVFTAFEQFIGTPVYMSPEQAEMSSLDIDTRSDIYSLGVLLYELLTGKPPLDPKALVRAGVDQIRQHIREVEPPTPSRRLHTLAEDERTTIARLRGTAPAQLSVLLRGDLDWIIMRCLEKDRTRRYDTANGLALDIQRHLRNEPIVARAPSTVYLLQKLFRRHRVGFVAAVAIIVALGAGAIVSTWQAVRAKNAETLAETALQAEAKLRQEAERQEDVARGRAYAADMNLVAQTLMDGNLESALALLNRNKPHFGQRDLRGWEWRYLWQLCQPDWDSVLSEKAGRIYALSTSDDGGWLAVAGGQLSVWNLTTRKELKTKFLGNGFTRVAFAPGRSLLAAYTSDTEDALPEERHRIMLWNPETEELIREIPLPAECAGLFFSADAKTLAAATLPPDNNIILWSVADGTELRRIPAPQRSDSRGEAFAATPDLALGAHGTPEGQLRFVDLNTGDERGVYDVADKGNVVLSLAFSPDGRQIASSATFDDSTIRVWDVASGKMVQQLRPQNGLLVFSFRFLPDGKTLVSAGADGSIRVWDVPSGKEIDRLQGHKLHVMGLALLPDQKTLVSGARDGVVSLWNLRARRWPNALIQLPEPIGAWRFADDGKSLLTVAADGRIVRWQGVGLSEKKVESNVGQIIADWRMGPEQFSPNLQHVALQRTERQLEVWDTRNNRLIQKFDTAVDIHPVAHFRDNHTLRVFDQRGADFLQCQEWDLSSGRATRTWQIPISSLVGSDAPTVTSRRLVGQAERPFFAVTISADGDRYLVTSPFRKSVAYDVRTGASQLVEIDLKYDRFAQFSPDGQLLAGRGSLDFKVWEAGSFREVGTLTTKIRVPQSAAFSPDGARLAVGNGSKTVVLWNLQTNEPVLTLGGNGGEFRRTAFSPDGSRIGTLSTMLPKRDGILNVWWAPTWADIEAAEKRAASARLGP